jgi:hypothetical protein
VARRPSFADLRASVGRLPVVAALALSNLFVACDAKPSDPRFGATATAMPMSASERARIIETLKHYVAKNYHRISLTISYDDLDELAKLRKFLLGVNFVRRVGSHWRFTKTALAQADVVEPYDVSFPIAHGSYDGLTAARYGGPESLGGGNSMVVLFRVRSLPDTKLGRLLAASSLLSCVQGYPHRRAPWKNDGGVTTESVFLDYDTLAILDDHTGNELKCPETRDR